MTTGIWLGASYALGRDVPVDEPYVHICHLTVPGRMTWHTVQLRRRDCAACLTNQPARPAPDRPPVTDEHRAEEARRLGERE
jgi:hypothetical protein